MSRGFLGYLLGIKAKKVVEPESGLNKLSLPAPPRLFPDSSAGLSRVTFYRHPDSYYHTLSDENFVEWARSYLDNVQVLTSEDRERIIDRILDCELNVVEESGKIS